MENAIKKSPNEFRLARWAPRLGSLRQMQFPAPSIGVFFALQILDILTTLMGLRLGAEESSLFVGQMLHLGTVAGLLISKAFAMLLAFGAWRFRRPRLIVFLNYWFAAVVTWNLAMVLISALSA